MEMIKGVTLLSEETTMFMPWWGALLIAIVVGLVVGVIIFVNTDSVLASVISFFVFGTVAFFIMWLPDKEPVPRYKVLVDNSLDWDEFADNYEIIDQDGKILTIKLKD